MLHNAHIPVLGFAAFSGTGKTTLLSQVVPLLRAAGLELAVVKHAHHTFDVDTPGKDSYELRQAGAPRVLLASRKRWVLMVERPDDREPTLDEVLLELDQHGLDLVLVEGFKHERFAKIELYRPSLGRPPFFPDDDSVVAIASDGPLSTPCPVPVFDLNDPGTIADFVVRWASTQPGAGPGLAR
jgi:molybdopterin-guanine dinucleotide biosynthesis protein MobB